MTIGPSWLELSYSYRKLEKEVEALRELFNQTAQLAINKGVRASKIRELYNNAKKKFV